MGANNPDQPDDNGKIGMPKIDEGMNKLPPDDAAPPESAKSDNPKQKEDDKEKERAKKKEAEIIALAKKRFQRCVQAESTNRAQALEDLKFKAGDHWPEDIKSQRADDKRPCLTINTIPALTHQVTNDLRQNRPAINISPIGNKADKEGAKAFSGMINAIERDCAADIAYDTAITSAADIGFGYVRILTEFERENSMNRVIVIKRVRNSFTVYLDPERQEPDGCDAGYGFVTVMISRSEFADKYPDADQMAWPEKGVGDDLKQWMTKDLVRIAEYFTIEHEMRRLVQLSNGNVQFYDDLGEEAKKAIEAKTIEIVSERDSECQRVVWYKITATQILDTEKWAGRWIPIVEFVGEEIDLQGEVIRSGLIRNAKDPARMKDYWATAKCELVALAPKAPYIMAEGQDEGYDQEWKTANVKSTPVLHYVPVALGGQPVPPPARQEPVGISTGIVEAEKSAEADLKATTGISTGSEMAEARYDESGKKLHEMRRSSNIGSYHYQDNAARSLRHVGRILVDLIPKIYDTRRVVTILQEDDSEERVTIDPSSQKPMDRQTGAKESVARKIFNPGMGDYGVTVTIGPSYATKRIEASDQMMSFAKALPEKGALIAHLIAKYSDWPGADECYKILTKALPPNLLTPDIRDLPPQIQTFVQQLTQQVAKLMAERTGMLKDLTDQRADRALRKEKIDKDFEAKLLKIFADLKKDAIEHDEHLISETMDATREFHDNLARQGFNADNPQPDRQAAPMSAVKQPGANE